MSITRETPIQYLKGVGPKRAELFNKLGIVTAGDLLEHFPRGYDFQPDIMRSGELYDSASATVGRRSTLYAVQSQEQTPEVRHGN